MDASLLCYHCAGWWWWCNGVGDVFLTLGPLVPIGHRFNATSYLSIVSDHVHPFMGTMSQSLNNPLGEHLDMQTVRIFYSTGFFNYEYCNLMDCIL